MMVPAKKKASTAAAAPAASSSSSSSSSSPTGIQLPQTPNWSIGRELGAGSQGAVYEILVGDAIRRPTNKKSNDGLLGHIVIVSSLWVCKVVPVPAITKKKTSAPEMNAGSLSKESLLYQSLLGPTLRGVFIPKIPQNPIPAYQQKVNGGFNCLIIERMECSLHDGLLQLLQSSSSSSSSNSSNSINGSSTSYEVHLGSLAAKMMDLAQAIHEKKHLIVDVKPDNLMLAQHDTSTAVVAPKKKAAPKRRSAAAAAAATVMIVDTAEMAGRLRLIDLGLMTPFKVQEPGGTGALRGNAKYASLHMHQLVTSSRRDDVEMLLYVLAEMVLLIQQQQQQQAHQPGGSSNNNNSHSSLLAWSKGKSDEDVYNIKKTQVQNRKSDFYCLMGSSSNDSAAKIIYGCLQDVWALDFNTKPNYEEFKSKLSKLVVKVSVSAPTSVAAAAAAAPKKKMAVATTLKHPPVTAAAAKTKNASTQKDPPAAAMASAVASIKRTRRSNSRNSISSPTPISQGVLAQSPSPAVPALSSPSPRKPGAARSSTTTSLSIKGISAEASSRAARASAREVKKGCDSRTIATQTSPDLMPPAVASHATTMGNNDNGKANGGRCSKRRQLSSSSTTAATARTTRLRLSTESDLEESFQDASSSLPSKIRKGNHDPEEVVDLMDVDSSDDEEQDGDDDDEFYDCPYDEDVEMESVSDENEKPATAATASKKKASSTSAAATGAKNPPPISVQLLVMTPGFDPHPVSLVQGKALILGSKPTKTGKWVEVPLSCPKQCILELVVNQQTTAKGIKKRRVIGIKVTGVDGVTMVDNGKIVAKGKSLMTTSIDNKITIGSSGGSETQTSITMISK